MPKTEQPKQRLSSQPRELLSPKPVLTRRQCHKIGARVDADPRTVRGYLDGSKQTAPALAAAIRAAVIEMGLPFERPEAP